MALIDTFDDHVTFLIPADPVGHCHGNEDTDLWHVPMKGVG